jgi:hypothetical protein
MSASDLADKRAMREDICGVFCENEPEVSFLDEWGNTVHWCWECFDQPCGRCGSEYDDDKHKRKGLCQACRDEISSWSEDSTKTAEGQSRSLAEFNAGDDRAGEKVAGGSSDSSPNRSCELRGRL